MIRVGVIGYGYWGPNIVRNFNSGAGSRVVKVCDSNAEALKRLNDHSWPVKTGGRTAGVTATPPT